MLSCHPRSLAEWHRSRGSSGVAGKSAKGGSEFVNNFNKSKFVFSWRPGKFSLSPNPLDPLVGPLQESAAWYCMRLIGGRRAHQTRGQCCAITELWNG